MMLITVFDSDDGRRRDFWRPHIQVRFQAMGVTFDTVDPAKEQISESTSILFLHHTDKDKLKNVAENFTTISFTGGNPQVSDLEKKIYWIQKAISSTEGPTFKEIQDIVDWVKCGDNHVSMPSILVKKPVIDHDKVALFIRCWVCKDQDRVNRLKLDKVWLRGEFPNDHPLLSSVCNELSNGSKLSIADVANMLYKKLEEDIKKNGVDK